MVAFLSLHAAAEKDDVEWAFDEQLMCIILFAYQADARYRLILAANRDEFYARPTARADFWTDAPQVLGGRDRERGGTWLGVTLKGCVAAVTNFRDARGHVKSGAPSRGHLVSDFLLSDESAESYAARIAPGANAYNGFNLILFDGRELCYLSNRAEGAQQLAPGVYGLSNHLLDTPWPKVTRGKGALTRLIERGREFETESLFAILADEARAEDPLLPKTGVGLEIERALSPLFIKTPEYGTRSSTLLLLDREDNITFIERTYEAGMRESADVSFNFRREGERL